MKINWTKEAIRDLDIIYRYYEEISQQTADKIYDRIVEETEVLQTFPHIASVEPLLIGKKPVARSLVVMRIFKVIYFIKSEIVVITNVWDCRQNPEELKQTFSK